MAQTSDFLLPSRYLLKKGADATLLTPDGERPIDLCDATDFPTIRVMLKAQSSIAVNNNDNDSEECEEEENSRPEDDPAEEISI